MALSNSRFQPLILSWSNDAVDIPVRRLQGSSILRTTADLMLRMVLPTRLKMRNKQRIYLETLLTLRGPSELDPMESSEYLHSYRRILDTLQAKRAHSEQQGRQNRYHFSKNSVSCDIFSKYVSIVMLEEVSTYQNARQDKSDNV
jgi:hypothetical protein